MLRHIYQFGFRSAPLILMSGFAIGVVLSMHTRASLERFGAEAMIPAGLAIALIRETGPLTAGLLVSGRVGAGIGAEIGAMRVTEQIDALEANAVDAFKYLAVTRIIALMIAMPLLTIMMDFAGIFGGYVAEATVSGMSWQLYFDRAFSYITYSDLIPATLKTIVFGFLIAAVASYLGFTTSRGTEGVGDASTRSVVMGVDPHHPQRRHPREDHLLLLPAGVGVSEDRAGRTTSVCRPSGCNDCALAAGEPAVRLDHVSKQFAAARCSTTCRSRFSGARRSVCSGAAAPARASRCGTSSGWCSRIAARCSSKDARSRR